MDRTTGKSKRIYVRVTEDEHRKIKEKAKNYPSLSSLVLDAVKDFDTRKGRNTIDRMIEFVQAERRFETQIVRIGNNLNQIAHALNLYRLEQDTLVPIEIVAAAVKEAQALNKDIIKSLRRIVDLTRQTHQ